MERLAGEGKPRVTGSPIEVVLVMFIAVAVIHAFVTPPADTRWRDEIMRAIVELDARQRLAHPELAPLPARVIEVDVVEPSPASEQASGPVAPPSPPDEPEPHPRDIAPESPPPGRYARVPIDREQVRDWSDDSSAPPWSATRDPRIGADEAGGQSDGQRRAG